MQLNDIAPWGRALVEYQQMFDLSTQDLQKRILGVSDGSGSFNAELTARGGTVVSVDPVYQFSHDQLEARISHSREQIMQYIRETDERYHWGGSIRDFDHLYTQRTQAMQTFLDDYHQGRDEGRYLAASLPELPFADKQFELALSSHFLFLFTHYFGLEQHIKSIRELCRVAEEVRIYPLISMDGGISEYLVPVMGRLAQLGYKAELHQVPYDFQKNADEMLVVSR